MTRWYRKRRPTKRRREFCCFPCVVARSANCPATNSIPFPQWHNCQCKKCRRARCTAPAPAPPPPVRRRRERNDGTIPRRRRRKTTREREQGCARTHAPRAERDAVKLLLFGGGVFLCCIFKEKKRGRKGVARGKEEEMGIERLHQNVQKSARNVWVLCVHDRLILFFEKG